MPSPTLLSLASRLALTTETAPQQQHHRTMLLLLLVNGLHAASNGRPVLKSSLLAIDPSTLFPSRADLFFFLDAVFTRRHQHQRAERTVALQRAFTIATPSSPPNNSSCSSNLHRQCLCYSQHQPPQRRLGDEDASRSCNASCGTACVFGVDIWCAVRRHYYGFYRCRSCCSSNRCCCRWHRRTRARKPP